MVVELQDVISVVSLTFTCMNCFTDVLHANLIAVSVAHWVKVLLNISRILCSLRFMNVQCRRNIQTKTPGGHVTQEILVLDVSQESQTSVKHSTYKVSTAASVTSICVLSAFLSTRKRSELKPICKTWPSNVRSNIKWSKQVVIHTIIMQQSFAMGAKEEISNCALISIDVATVAWIFACNVLSTGARKTRVL